MPYCAKEDLLTGNIPLPTYVNANKYVSDAADEIDSHIGTVYQTPVDITPTSGVPRAVKLLLKRINVHLASGRLVLAMAAGQENLQQHAYGQSLVDQAMAAISGIVSGEIVLDGVSRVTMDTSEVTTPMIANVDSESNVEAFYDRIANPNYTYFGRPSGGGFVL